MEALGYDGLIRCRRNVPAPGAGQVTVRMRAASLNYRDLKILNGSYGKRQPRLPIIPLSDGAGEIAAVGSGVTAFTIGDRVLPIYMEGWHSGPFTLEGRAGWKAKAGDTDGVAVEFATYDQSDVLQIPDSLSFQEAACLPCAAVTAWHALIEAGQIKPGDTVLTQGSGAVSLFAIQIAKMAGARVIATSSNDTKLARLSELGAWNVINYAKTPSWQDTVLDMTDGGGVDHVVEVGGSETIQRSLQATKQHGHIASVGNLSGGFAHSATSERGISISHITVGSGSMTKDVMHSFDVNNIRPLIDKQFSIYELKDALRYLAMGQHFGKIVLTF